MKDIKMYIEDLIVGHLSNRLSSDELNALKEWLGASPENEKHYLILREIWFSSGNASDRRRFDKDKAWQRFLKHSGMEEEPVKVPIYRKSWRVVWQAAAAVAVLIVASYLSFLIGGKQLTVSEQVAEYADINIEASWGAIVKNTLPDGTTVWLNANSKITYSQGFGISDRNVLICGEAYFEVAKNENLPFCVNSNEMKVNVVGTKFNFRNYLDDREATVWLLEGKVSIENLVAQGNEETMMEPNQKIFIDKLNGDSRMKTVTARNTVAWTNGYLFFDEELLADIVKDLERNYDVKITVHPAAENIRFYGRFVRKEQSVMDILDILAATGKIKYSIAGKEIVIINN